MKIAWRVTIVSGFFLVLLALYARQPAQLLAANRIDQITGGVDPCYRMITVPCANQSPQQCNPTECIENNTCCDLNFNCLKSPPTALINTKQDYRTAAPAVDVGREETEVMEPITCFSSFWCNESPCVLVGALRACVTGGIEQAGLLYWPENIHGDICDLTEDPVDP